MSEDVRESQARTQEPATDPWERRCRQAAYLLRNGLGNGTLELNRILDILEKAA
jgi:hypothetical protein